MVLIGFGVIAVLQYAGIGHIFQIGADFPFHEPGKGIAPAKMHTSSLMMTSMECHCRACVCSWVNISLNSSSVCEDGWIKIQWKKEKGPSALGSRCIFVLPICTFAASACQVDDARQLHDEAYHQQCHYSPIGDIGIF